jgi:hypothetical protein
MSIPERSRRETSRARRELSEVIQARQEDREEEVWEGGRM